MDQQDVYAMLIRGRDLLGRGHHHQAATVLERASLLEPEKTSIREELARALYLSGQKARDAGKPLLCLTNNASYLPAWIVSRLAEGGIKITEDEVLTSALAARSWIEREGLVGQRAFVLGVQTVIDGVADLLEVVPVERGTKVGVVLVARDVDVTYDRLAAASDAVRDGAVFAASNRDNVVPIPGGFEPGPGST